MCHTSLSELGQLELSMYKIEAQTDHIETMWCQINKG